MRSAVAALALLGAAPAAGQVPFDERYATRPAVQGQPITARIDRILWPTIAFPALVRSGGSFEVAVRTVSGPDGRPLTPSASNTWAAFLIASGAAERVPIVEVRIGREVTRVQVRVPVALARDVYDLRLAALGLDDVQPNAVRVLGPGRDDAFMFAVMSDHQLWDPSHRLFGKQLSAGKHPRAGDTAGNRGIAAQGWHELALHDPDFVIHAGDLVFGLDYRREYDEAHELLRQARLPVFGVPGNHDGYAIYNVRLHRRPLTFIAGAVGCRKQLAGEMSWARAWKFIGCVYGDVKELFFADLQHDGLEYWRRIFGPTDFAFSRGRFLFVGLNTYSGSPERRHAFSIYMDAFDLHLGAPAVDNYGGYVTDEQLRLVEEQARRAAKQGLTLVVIGHHDPRGNAEGRRYHANESFPKDPVSSAGFEEWNYDATSWDSDPKDARRAETADRNSAVALLGLLSQYGGYYLSGHVHHDSRAVYAKGAQLGPWTVQKPVEFIRTTTASSSVKGDGYSGYRLITAKDARLEAVDFAPQARLASVPAGNLWVNELGVAGGVPEMELVTGLPRATRAVVRWSLPAAAAGYRFRVRPADGSGATLDPAQRPEVLQLARRGDRLVFWVAVQLPAAQFPPTERRLLRYRLRALAARDNRPPVAQIDVLAGPLPRELAAAAAAAGDAGPDGGAPPAVALAGQELRLSAQRSADPEGDRIIAYLWDLGGGREASGPEATARFDSRGLHTVQLTLIDEAGARQHAIRSVDVRLRPTPRGPPPVARRPAPPGCAGCCVPGIAVSGGVAIGLILGLAVMGLVARRRRRGGAKQDTGTGGSEAP